MKMLRFVVPLFLIVFLAACSRDIVTPTPNPTPAPGTELPVVPPDTTPVNPTPTPTPGNVPYYGEWLITYTSDLGTSFVHALQVSQDVSADGLRNAGGGLQEFCTGGSNNNTCEGVYGSGIGFIGNLVLDDGTAPLTLAIATSYGGATPEVKLVTIEDIDLTTNGQGQQTFTADAAWFLTPTDPALGTITATNIGAPKTLDPLTMNHALGKVFQLTDQVRKLRLPISSLIPDSLSSSRLMSGLTSLPNPRANQKR